MHTRGRVSVSAYLIITDITPLMTQTRNIIARPAPARGKETGPRDGFWLNAPFLSRAAHDKVSDQNVFSSPVCPAHPPCKVYQSASESHHSPDPAGRSDLAPDIPRSQPAVIYPGPGMLLSLSSPARGPGDHGVTTGTDIQCPVRARGAFLVLNEGRETTDRIRLNGPGVCLSKCLNGQRLFSAITRWTMR